MKVFTNGDFFENTYLINNKENEAILVDPGEGLDEYLEELNQYNIKAILLTHGHMDHIDGIKHFLNVPIYIYKDEEDFLSSPDLSLYRYFNKHMPFNISDLSIHLLKEGTINLLGFNIEVIATSGHTKGSVCYLVDNKYLFSGDTLFQCSIGRTDFPTGSTLDMNKSLDRLKKLSDDVRVFPGHGAETSIKFEKQYNPYFR